MSMNEPAQIKLDQPRGTTLINLAVAAIIIAGLYLGRQIFVPVSLAVLLSFALAPFVLRLQTWRIPRVAAVIIVVAISFAAIFSLGGLMVTQATRLAEDLPSYQNILQEKVGNLRGFGSSGTLERASQVLKDLNKELQNTDAPGSVRDNLNRPTDSKPIPVEVRQPDPGALSTLVAIITPLLSPLTTSGIVIIFVVFILMQRQDLRNRFVRLAGSRDIQRTTAALDEAGQRLSKLFLTQIIFNAVFGTVVGTGLWLIGVPSAPLWGLIAAIMRFVPYLGSFMGAIFPVILAAAVGSGWGMLIQTVALFLVLDLFAGQVLEPIFFGRSSGLSPVAVIASASFWTWLWGPVGLVLATPLTICLVVVGRHIERLQFLDIMLGDHPPLSAPQLAYQRLLAGDPIEATEQARSFLQTDTLGSYYDGILLESLKLAETDNRLGRLDDGRLERIESTVADIAEDLETHEDAEMPTVEGPAGNSGLDALEAIEKTDSETKLSQSWKAPRAVLCIAGASRLDQAAAISLAQLLRRRGMGAMAEKFDTLSVSRFFSLDLSEAALICICYVDTPTSAKVHYATRRLLRKKPGCQIVLSLLGNDVDLETIVTTGFVSARTFQETVSKVQSIAASQTDLQAAVIRSKGEQAVS